MAERKRRQWYQVEISYETQGGEWKTARSEPTTDHLRAMTQCGEYQQTGFRAIVIECAEPAKETATKRSSATRVGSHD